MYQLALSSEEDAKRGRSRSGNAAVKLVLVAHKSDLINVGSLAASGASYAAAVSGPATEKKSSFQSQAKGEIAVNRVRSILERELTKRASDLRNSVSIEGLGSDQPSSSSGDQGVIDSSSGLTGLECVGSGGVKEGFKFANWEYGEVDFVSSWVEVSRQEFDDEDASADTDAEEKGMGDKDGEDGLAEVKGWLNRNLA